MGFNADAFLAARERWTLTIKGRTYEAAPVSVLQVMAFQRDLEAAGDDTAQQRAALTTLLRAMFPARWAYVWSPDPVALVLKLDSGAQSEVLRDFFTYLARTLGLPQTGTTTPPSPPSSAPTPTPTPWAEEDGA